MSEIETFIRDAARARGIDPDIAVRVAESEGSVTEPARRGTFATGSSWWPFQLHYGGKGYEHLGTTAGMGTGFTILTGWQPGDPAAWRDSVRYALNRAKSGGWGAWYGAKHVGIGNWAGIDTAAKWDGNSETWDYEQKVKPPKPEPAPTFVPDRMGGERQEHSYDCSAETIESIMEGWGRSPADDWVEQTMIAEGVMSADQGLLDASGTGLAAFVNRHYGAELGYVATSHDPVTFARVYSVADGTVGVGIGGRAWNHWSAVRRAADGVLYLANSAPGHMGVEQTMSRQQFDALGPFSMVAVRHKGSAPVEPPAPPAPTDELGAARARIASLETALAHLADVVAADRAREIADEAQRIRVEFLGPRPAR